MSHEIPLKTHPQAIGERIWVIKDPRKPCFEKGILIPESAERTPRFGPSVEATVVSVGKRCKELKPGQRIILKDIAGDDYTYDGHTYTHLRERDIVGISE